MALKGTLTIGGATYEVIECTYEFSQSIDETGKPVSRPHGGSIKFLMPSTSDDDVFFYKWMFNKTEVKSGVFRFSVYSQNNKESFKNVEFTNAYCVSLKDYFSDSNSKLMCTEVTLSAEVIKIGSSDTATFTNEWT